MLHKTGDDILFYSLGILGVLAGCGVGYLLARDQPLLAIAAGAAGLICVTVQYMLVLPAGEDE